MRKTDKLTYEILSKLLRYEPDTGKLYWLYRDKSFFENPSYSNTWNTKNSGKEALTNIKSNGYRAGSVFKIHVHAHRVAWVLYYREWPKGDIDHIDHDRSNNKIENLRDVTRELNSRNKRMSKYNKSGYTGVHFHLGTKKWRTQIRSEGRTICLGLYNSLEEAYAARLEANKKFSYHENHGR